MKYIRTKDGKIFNLMDLIKWNKNQGLVENEISFWNSAYRYPEKHKQGLKARILKQADIIEELCDEFVDTSELKTTNTGGWLYDEFDSDNKCLIYYVEDERRTIPLNEFDDLSKIYGAIWTDKGLQFVARMNSKGELELL